uniref:Syntrophin gamma 2 n=1 Tax=Eptatretus burgeri TaxID=7764 RepID=A0A8C4X1G9_EPTBU
MNGSCSHSGASPPASPEAHQLRWQKRWCDALSLPLLMARVSCYAPGTHHQRCEEYLLFCHIIRHFLNSLRMLTSHWLPTCRPNALEVIAVDGVSSGVLQSPNPALCAEWFRAIADNISDLIAHNMRMVNKYAPAHDQIVHMGWVHERLPEPEAWISYRNRFLALRGDHVMIFSCPPVSTRDWGKAESGYLVYEVFCRPLKAAELHEERAFSFSLLIGPGRSRRFAVEHASEMSMWEKAFQMAGFLEVQRIGCVTYRCSYKGQALTLKIDFSHGFTCFDFNTKLPLWSFKFGQLRGSSDDGIARVRFLFLNTETKIVERKELEFANYIAVLHCVHAFVAARVSLVDPGFVESRRGQHKAGCSKAEACG